MLQLYRQLLAACIDVVAPRRCAGCDILCREDLCPACTALVLPPTPRCVSGAPVLSVGPYQAPLSEGVKRLKYQQRPDVAVPLGRLLARAVKSYDVIRHSTLVPVPLHPARLAERGFNQSALIATSLSKHFRAPTNHRLLFRARRGPAQALCSHSERQLNVAGAFSAVQPPRASRLTLVDDVVTTGATAAECVNTLRSAGHYVVAVVAICSTGKADC